MKRTFRIVPNFFLAIRHDIRYSNRGLHCIQRPLPFRSSVFPEISVSRVPNFTHPLNLGSISTPAFYATFPIETQGDADGDVGREFESDIDDVEADDASSSSSDLATVLEILQTGASEEKSKKLEQCGINATPDLVANVISGRRNDWEAAFTFFLWAGKQPGYKHSLREYHSMIAILGKFRKFDTAWGLIDDMRAESIVTPHTLLIMIRKYAAVHDVAKAINTFYAHKRFKFEMGREEFHGLLSALCRYKNVKDAEHLLFCNKTVFPFSTKSFNIILNGWCNVIGELREGRRIWKEMEVRGIKHDVYSYGSLISGYSKLNNLHLVLNLYERMKSLGIKSDRKVYNAVIHALAKGKLVNEARNLMNTMEDEGFRPDAVTYNSFIMPLCKFRMLDEANRAFDEMVKRGLLPTVRTYHGLFRGLRTGEEVFGLLENMHSTGCHPCHDTYIMLIRKFCRLRQIDNVFKVWDEMKRNMLDPDRSSYIVLIHGLFLNGRLEEAHKYYMEMKEKHLVPEPNVDAMLQAWLEGKRDGGDSSVTAPKDKQSTRRKDPRNDDFLLRPELRNVVREKGFSFWDP